MVDALKHIGCGTERCFQNAARCAEDGGCTGGNAHDRVEILFRQSCEVELCHLDHAGKLAGGDGDIDIRHTGCVFIVTVDLEFLRDARHDGNGDDVVRVDAFSFCKPRFDERTGHLLRGLAGGEVFCEVREVVLAELDPARRAGGDDRQLAAVLHAVNELVRFFHDGHIGTEIGIVDLIEAKAAQSCDHLAFYVRADRHAKLFAERCAHSRSRLHDDDLFGIVDGIDDVLRVVLLGQSAGRAGDDALAAGNAGHFAERHLKCAADLGIETAVVCADDGDVLLLAGCHAAAAQDALCVISFKVQRAVILLAGGNRAFIAVFAVDAHIVAELLQLAGAASLTGETFAVMHGEQELQCHFSGFLNLRRIGEDLHALVYRVHAGGNKRSCALDFDHAHTACADLVDVLQEAKGGNVDSGFSCGFEDRAAGSDLIGHAVDLNIYHIHAILNFLPYFFSMAPNLHFSRQTPHLMHFCVSMTCGSRTVPEMAPTGQLRAQSVQPLHLSASMT